MKGRHRRISRIQRLMVLVMTIGLIVMSVGTVNATESQSLTMKQNGDQAGVIQEFHVSNGKINIKFTENRDNIKSKDLVFTKSVNNGPERRLTVRQVNWNQNTHTATFSFSPILSGSIEQVVKIGVSYKGSQARFASFTLASINADVAELEIINPSEDEIITVGSRDDSSLKLSAIARDESGNQITGKKIIWSSSNKNVAAVDRQGNVKAVGKGTALIKAQTGDIEASLRITVEAAPPKIKSFTATNGAAIVILTDSPEEDPEASDFLLSLQIDRQNPNQVSLTDFDWQSEHHTAYLWFDEIAPTAKSQRIISTVEYRGSKKTAKAFTIARATDKVYKVKIYNYSPDNKLDGDSPVDYILRLQAVALNRTGYIIADRQVHWISGDISVATVDENGMVTAVGEGETRIKATIDGVSASYTVRVIGTVVRPSITLSASMISESPANDGSVDESLRVNLNNGKFAEDISAEDVEVSNLPSGLGIILTLKSDTRLDIAFKGKAAIHNEAASRDDLKIVINKSKVHGAARDIASEEFSIHFHDPVITPTPPAPLPNSLAQGLAFTDTDVDQGQIAGDMTWQAAADERNLRSYVVYFLDNQDSRLGSAIATINKGDPYLITIQSDTVIPFGAAKIGVFSKNTRGESVTAASIALVDVYDQSSAQVALAQTGDKTEDQTFELDVTGGKSFSGAELSGTLKVTVVADNGTTPATVVDDQDIVFVAGEAKIPVIITDPGLYTLQVLITGVQGSSIVPDVNVVEGKFAGGKGTVDDPYLIRSANQLNNVRSDMTAHYALEKDIDLGVAPFNQGEGWLPIGDVGNRFQGSFDGRGHTISNLYINRQAHYQGLFGFVDNGTIHNVRIENVNITVTGLDTSTSPPREHFQTGALAGRIKFSTVSHCFVSGTISGLFRVGGLVGLNEEGTITDCTIDASVTGSNSVGGLLGANWGIVRNSHVTTDSQVKAARGPVGGLVGINYTNVVNPSAVYATIETSYSDAFVEGGTDSYAGGLVGQSSGAAIKRSYATGDVIGNRYVGGLVATNADFNTNEGVIENSYSTGNVTGTDIVGGLVGNNPGGTIRYCYAAGAVNATGLKKGGLVAEISGTTDITSSYYDSQTTGRTDSGKGEPRTTDDMKTQSTFVGWDFSGIWTLPSDSYPLLK